MTPEELQAMIRAGDEQRCHVVHSGLHYFKFGSYWMVEADLNRIYEMVEVMAPEKVGVNEHYKAKVRQTLQLFFTNVKRGVYRVQE